MSFVARYILSAILSVAALAPAAWFYSRAAAQHTAATTRLERLRSHVATLAAARSALPEWAVRTITPGQKQSTDALAPRVTAALTSCGLTPGALANLSVQSAPEGPIIAGGLRIHRRRATLVLSHISLPRLGAFLQTWRAAEPDWRPTAIDAAPESVARGDMPTAPGADLPLRVVLSLESLAIQTVGPAPPAGALR